MYVLTLEEILKIELKKVFSNNLFYRSYAFKNVKQRLLPMGLENSWNERFRRSNASAIKGKKHIFHPEQNHQPINNKTSSKNDESRKDIKQFQKNHQIIFVKPINI